MSKTVERAENGKLKINMLDLQILIGDMFNLCKTEHEIEFVSEAIIGTAENITEEMIDGLN